MKWRPGKLLLKSENILRYYKKSMKSWSIGEMKIYIFLKL